MLVFWDQRLAFLATPKTGSTAIEQALESLASLVVLRPPALKHTTVQRYHRFVGPYLAAASGVEFTVIAMMRQPQDWLGSWYRYRQRDDLPDPRKSTVGLDFDEFVGAYCSENPPEFAAVGSQARFLQARNQRGVDRLFKYEDPASFITFIEDRLQCEVILPRVNVSPEAPMVLTPKTQSLLRRFAAADFDLYQTLGKD